MFCFHAISLTGKLIGAGSMYMYVYIEREIDNMYICTCMYGFIIIITTISNNANNNTNSNPTTEAIKPSNIWYVYVCINIDGFKMPCIVTQEVLRICNLHLLLNSFSAFYFILYIY